MKQLMSANDDSQEVHTKFMVNDLERWSAELKMIDFEISFYGDFLDSASIETTGNHAKSQFVATLQELKIGNVKVTQEFQEFSNKLQGIIECDDLQCETYYVNNHTDFKHDIENHFAEFRSFKRSLLDYFREVAIK